MSVRTYVAALLLLVALACTPAHASEEDDRLAISTQVHALVDAKDYVGLDALTTKYRDPRERTSSGFWKLAVFYRILLSDYFSDEQNDPVVWERNLAWAKAWTEARPNSPSAHTLLGRAILHRGLAYRGTSVASEVPEASWAPFREHAARALAYLLEHKKIASRDPFYYSSLQSAAHRNRWAVEDFMAIFDEGAARYPQYQPIFFVRVNTYFARQYGGTPEQVEIFARHALTKVPAGDRASLYARIYLESWEFTQRNAFYYKRVDWPLMSKGIDDILARYPSQYNLQAFAFQACMARDLDKSVALVKRISSPPDMRVWGAIEFFEVCGDPAAWESPTVGLR